VGAIGNAKKENRFFIETHSPRASDYAVYPRVFALVRPGSFQIRKRKGTGAGNSGEPKKDKGLHRVGGNRSTVKSRESLAWIQNGKSSGFPLVANLKGFAIH
jgi:hypothetical protein